MKPKLILGLVLALSGGLFGCSTTANRPAATIPPEQIQKQTEDMAWQSEEVVEQMRGFSMQSSGNGERLDDGTIDPKEQRRQEIISQFRVIGKQAIPALVHALRDPDVQMRRNAELVMISLAGAYDGEPRVDIREAIPALIKATGDGDSEVRAWAAHALAEIGPDAKDAVPALLKFIHDSDEGPRNTSCMALGDIGPEARDALPALRNALNDPNKDVRRFAKQAIEKIQNK
jgi:HEAT repeat protein